MTKRSKKPIGVRVVREFGTTLKGKTFWGKPGTIHPLSIFTKSQLDFYLGSKNIEYVYQEVTKPVVAEEVSAEEQQNG